jgi:hypothetical protein
LKEHALSCGEGNLDRPHDLPVRTKAPVSGRVTGDPTPFSEVKNGGVRFPSAVGDPDPRHSLGIELDDGVETIRR